MIRTHILYSWNIQLKRNLNDWKVDDMTLERYELRDIDGDDERLWMLDVDKGFFGEINI